MPTKPSQPRLRARYDERRERVIATAAELFARRGYQATSIADLSEAAGLAVGGIYHYIDGKEQLLFAIFGQLMDPLLERADAIAAAGDAPEEKLRELVRAWVRHVADHRFHMLVFAQERHAVESDPRWQDVRRSRRAFEARLGAIIGDLDGRSGDRRLLALALLGMVNHMPTWYRPGGRLTPEAIADGYSDLVLDAIRA
ncbi:TetR/AcrR family transcriptional regulator [Capillimicrobium parvum]|uniref:HTH-type transcriptional repressor KstR2 n=1 Tax=Capillimicrobium parvum TaxID=2884022 RepID=A0A9E6XUJ4_9ACTN|nr:TetR/AcrR family transcriptional regulator [Capillimicrobium parvum]UGS34042.1 HTH-type transcriptional repressor KstR2 [Capillimicrobium parvum]